MADRREDYLEQVARGAAQDMHETIYSDDGGPTYEECLSFMRERLREVDARARREAQREAEKTTVKAIRALLEAHRSVERRRRRPVRTVVPLDEFDVKLSRLLDDDGEATDVE